VSKAKNTNAKGKAKAKAKKDDKGIPKKVAGVKVPKAVRESSSLSTLFNSALGREIIADALIAAAGAAAAALTRTRAAKKAGNAVADTGAEAVSASAELMNTAAGAVAGVVTEAAKSFLPASLVGDDQGKDAGQDGKRPRYAHLASDHNVRRTSKKAEKAVKPDKG
jgi:hypothetical protein